MPQSLRRNIEPKEKISRKVPRDACRMNAREAATDRNAARRTAIVCERPLYPRTSHRDLCIPLRTDFSCQQHLCELCERLFLFLQGLQVFDQVVLLFIRQRQPEKVVIVFNDILQSGEAAVMVETGRKKAADSGRCSANTGQKCPRFLLKVMMPDKRPLTKNGINSRHCF